MGVGLYSDGMPSPTYRNVSFPMSGTAGDGTVGWGEVKFNVPASLLCRGAFAAVFLDAGGRAPSTDRPVEISTIFERNIYYPLGDRAAPRGSSSESAAGGN